MKMLACLAIGAATTLGSVGAIAFPALAQQPSERRLCRTPTASDYDITDADRRFAPDKPHLDATTEWHKGFVAAVQRCQKGDALLIEREVMALAARFCDLDKPFAFKAGPAEAALCSYVGGERAIR